LLVERLRGVRFKAVLLGGAASGREDLQGADFSDAHLEGANFWRANFITQEFRRA
jgi:uncharacterized protein YjbI with pentapeptide repeats